MTPRPIPSTRDRDRDRVAEELGVDLATLRRKLVAEGRRSVDRLAAVLGDASRPPCDRERALDTLLTIVDIATELETPRRRVR